MKVSEATWQEIGEFSRDGLIILPTGSLEQHGPHLPLITDSLIVTSVGEAVESRLVGQVLLLPTLWLGASSHHLSFAGSASASFSTYIGALRDILKSYQKHGFRKFLLLNGHGGNADANRIALREAKDESPNDQFAHVSYFDLIAKVTRETLTGPMRQMGHACEAETSLVLHLRPQLVRTSKIRDDGMRTEPSILGMVLHFDELSDEGSMGFATQANAQKGRLLFEAAVDACTNHARGFLNGFVMTPIEE